MVTIIGIFSLKCRWQNSGKVDLVKGLESCSTPNFPEHNSLLQFCQHWGEVCQVLVIWVRERSVHVIIVVTQEIGASEEKLARQTILRSSVMFYQCCQIRKWPVKTLREIYKLDISGSRNRSAHVKVFQQIFLWIIL